MTAPDAASPAIILHLDRPASDFGDPTGGFKPLSLPDVARFEFDKDLVGAVRSASVAAEAALAPGTYALPLSQGAPCQLEVPDDCRIALRAELTPAEDGQGAVIASLEANFTAPLVFHNILSTLTEVRHLFRDSFVQHLRHQAHAALDLLGASPLLGRSVEVLTRAVERGSQGAAGRAFKRGLAASGQVLDIVGEVHLLGFRADLARTRSARQQLVFRFSGYVLASDRVRIPFHDLRVSSFLLPTLQATLRGLVSDNPLASAELLRDRLPIQALARIAVPMLRDFQVRADLRVQVPPVALHLQTFSRSELTSTIALDQPAEVALRLNGEVDAHERLHVHADTLRVRVADQQLTAEARLDLDVREAVELLLAFVEDPEGDAQSPPLHVATALLDGAVQPGTTARIDLTIHEGSGLQRVHVLTQVTNPLTIGATRLAADIVGLTLDGSASVSFDGPGRRLVLGKLAMHVGGSLEQGAGSHITDGVFDWNPERFGGDFDAVAEWTSEEAFALAVRATLGLEARGVVAISPIPELGVDSDRLDVSVAGTAVLSGGLTLGDRGDGYPVLDFTGTRLALSLDRGELHSGDVRFELPADTELQLRVARGYLATTGLGETELRLSWDLQGQSPRLSKADRRTSIFVEALRSMDTTVSISRAGRLAFYDGVAREDARRDGLYDGAFLNALVNPGDEHEKWLAILADGEAMEHVMAAIGVLAPELERRARKAHAWFEEARAVKASEGIERPADFIPRARMARFFSRVLAGDERYVEPLTRVIRQVTEGEGLDRSAVEAIVAAVWPDHPYRFELDRILRWLDLVLTPAEPLPPPTAREVVPLTDDPAFAELFASLPSARQVYEAVDGEGTLEPRVSRRLAELAGWLEPRQLAYVLEHTTAGRCDPADRARLAYVLELKRRVRMIAQGYGGFGYAPQATAIAFFLADVLDADRAATGAAPLEGFPPPGILGPEDVAVLLQAGLANIAQNRTVQINLHRLMDYIRVRPPLYGLGVLAEMGMRSERVLTGVLLALLHHDQLHMAEPLDLAALLSEVLGVEIPRREHYMAGGRWAKESYYQALMRTAEYILAAARPYLAVKLHLQTVRHEAPAGPALRKTPRKRDAAALRAVEEADAVAARCTFEGEASGPVADAVAAYGEAFHACAAAQRAERAWFQRPEFKRFWRRNYEALMVRSVVDNVRNGVDQVPRWLEVRTGSPVPAATQDLVEAVVSALYHFPEDQHRLLADPLVRLLIPAPEGRLDFTVVSGMGVVTDGAKGRELEDAFLRLEAQRGVRLVRANTGTAQTLEYNAERVIEAIAQVDTPYGLIGYSQGCANVLMAESTLRAGTPKQQRLLEGLRCRNFLFSAANGSAHGSCGNLKFLRAMVEGESFLKFYQAICSASVIRLAQKAMGAALDSPVANHLIGSVDSLSHEGVIALARDGQYLDTVPTTTLRGVVVEAILPEALEFLSNTITRQVQGALHDTQVTAVSAVGYPDRIKNDWTRVLERCDLGSYAQTTHHWSPLIYTVELLTTERDRARAIYDMPKDRHVFPWVDLNVRFGNIELLPS